MFQVYNRSALTQKQRFLRAVLIAVPVSIIGGLLVGQLLYALVETSGIFFGYGIIYIGIGYLIGLLIQNVGRGVQVRFSILGAGCALLCFLCILVTQVIGLGNILHLNLILWILESYVRTMLSGSNFLTLIFQAIGVYAAFINSRIVR